MDENEWIIVKKDKTRFKGKVYDESKISNKGVKKYDAEREDLDIQTYKNSMEFKSNMSITVQYLK
jgi:hypothetical protein